MHTSFSELDHVVKYMPFENNISLAGGTVVQWLAQVIYRSAGHLSLWSLHGLPASARVFPPHVQRHAC